MRRLLLAVAMVLLTPVAGWSQTHPNMARGFDPEKLYQFNGLDTVNVMTGNLVITLPIGQTYPVSSHLSYGLQLVYNGNSWNYRVDGGAAEALPSRFNNAGLGWQLTLGELVGPNDPLATQTDAAGNWVYAGPDGSERSFYPALHAEEVGKSDYAASNSPAVGGWLSAPPTSAAPAVSRARASSPAATGMSSVWSARWPIPLPPPPGKTGSSGIPTTRVSSPE